MADRRPWAARRRPVDDRAYSGKMPVGGTILASGAVASGEDPQAEATARSGAVRASQAQVWAYRSQVGELAHAIQFYENCFSRIRLTLAVEEDDGTRTPAFDENGKAVVAGAEEALAALRQLRSPIGGQSQLMRAMGGCLGSVGEGHLVGTDSDRMKSGKSWEFLSPSEFFQPANAAITGAAGMGMNGRKAQAPRTYHRIRVPGQEPEVLTTATAAVCRIWQPDRQYSLLPWAPPLGMLDLFDELVLLTREVAGAVRSRLALAGILLVANDIEYPARDDAEDDSDERDPFTADLIRVASTAIKDKASAAGVLPLVVRVAPNRVGEAGANGEQGFRLLTFDRKWDDAASAKRAECVDRFAQGIDLPKEVVLGHMSTTFANAAQISADMYRLYIEPKVSIAADGLTTGYLNAQLPGTVFVIEPDPTDLIVKPDQTDDWKDAFDRYAISFSAYRNKLGASEDDAPDEDEIALRLEMEQSKHTRGVPGQEIAPAVLPDGSAPQLGVGGTAVGVEAATITAAMEVSVRRCMERVGARLRSKVQRTPGLASMIANVPDVEVAATLGSNTVRTLMTPAELVGRDFDAMHSWIAENFDRIVADDYRRQAIEEAQLRMFAPLASAR